MSDSLGLTLKYLEWNGMKCDVLLHHNSEFYLHWNSYLDIPLEVVPTPDNPQLDVVEQSLDNLLPKNKKETFNDIAIFKN